MAAASSKEAEGMDRFKNYSLGDKVFIGFVVVVLTLFFIAVLYP